MENGNKFTRRDFIKILLFGISILFIDILFNKIKIKRKNKKKFQNYKINDKILKYPGKILSLDGKEIEEIGKWAG